MSMQTEPTSQTPPQTGDSEPAHGGTPGAPHSQVPPTSWQSSPVGQRPPHSGAVALEHWGSVTGVHSQTPPMSVQMSCTFGQIPPHVGAAALTDSGSGGPGLPQVPALWVQGLASGQTPPQTGGDGSAHVGRGSNVRGVVRPTPPAFSPAGNS